MIIFLNEKFFSFKNTHFFCENCEDLIFSPLDICMLMLPFTKCFICLIVLPFKIFDFRCSSYEKTVVAELVFINLVSFGLRWIDKVIIGFLLLIELHDVENHISIAVFILHFLINENKQIEGLTTSFVAFKGNTKQDIYIFYTFLGIFCRLFRFTVILFFINCGVLLYQTGI